MVSSNDVDVMLNECFLALGRGVGGEKTIDYDAITWWRSRYRIKFVHALQVSGNSWIEDRSRVLAVSRWLGQRARIHSGEQTRIDAAAAARASAEVEGGCAMSKRHRDSRVV